ncbi:MAG: C45 family autoproteolytic acyltransferase/hydrolase [Planctomycetia bacterium]|nr:C45 family autoproteolytic acyltransferase/hydrolase [Planctomycetia bacterium]
MKHIDEALAVIGSACYLPGADSVESFWKNLETEVHVLETIPEERFRSSIYLAPKAGTLGKSHARIAGLIDFEAFMRQKVPSLLEELQKKGVPAESVSQDKGMLLCLYTAMEALRSAGWNPCDLPSREISTYLGIVNCTDVSLYDLLYDAFPACIERLGQIPELRDSIHRGEKAGIFQDYRESLESKRSRHTVGRGEDYDSSPHRVARHIHQVLGLRGMVMGFDNACSSSLVSLSLAQHYFREHPQGYALVGGISYYVYTGSIHFSAAHANSARGSFPMDDRAEGLVQGEGCAFSLVRPLRQALEAGDTILGIVRGVGVSSDGKGKTLWAPLVEGQKLAIERALEAAEVEDAEEIDLIEAHATSTRLGDATELKSLCEVLREKRKSSAPIPITSVKANIGHILEAAGMASLIKTLEGLRREVRLPQTHFEQPNSQFDWEHSPFVVPQEKMPWKISPTRGRQAIVEAFGIGGLNASVLVEGAESACKLGEKIARKGKKHAPIPVAVVGKGCVLPQAFDWETLETLWRENRSALSDVAASREDWMISAETQAKMRQAGLKKMGLVEGYTYDWKRHHIPPKQIALANPLQFMILGAVDQAAAEVGFSESLREMEMSKKSGNRERTAVVVGCRTDSDFNNVLGVVLALPEILEGIRQEGRKKGWTEEEVETLVKELEKGFYQTYTALKDETGGFTISTLASRISKTYDLRGGVYALDCGDVSSLAALYQGYALIQSGEVDTVFVAAGYRSLRKHGLDWLQKQNLQAPVPAEGAMAVVLKRYDLAKEEGNRIWGILDGVEGRMVPEVAEGTISPGEVFQTIRREMEKRSALRWKDPRLSSWERTLEPDAEEGYQMERLFGNLRPLRGMVHWMEQLCGGNSEKPEVGWLQQWDAEGMFYRVSWMNEAAWQVCRKEEKVGFQKEEKKLPRTMVSGMSRQRGKVVFLFPGQGSQYPGMLGDWLDWPSLRELVQELNEDLVLGGFPDCRTLLQTEGDRLGKDLFRTQLSLLVADTLLARYLREKEIVPEMVLGHSYGEYPALVAAEMGTFAQAAYVTQRRCEVLESYLRNFSPNIRTGMLSTDASEEKIARVIREVDSRGEEVFISNRNSFRQTILSGVYPKLLEVEKILRAEKQMTQILPVPAAFHSPLLRGMCESFEKALEGIRFQCPRYPFLSSVTGHLEADPELVRQNLILQMTRPVDFVAMIQKAYRLGGRHFVEVGPKKVLTNLARQILAEYADVTFHVLDSGKAEEETMEKVCREIRDAGNARKEKEEKTMKPRDEIVLSGTSSLIIGKVGGSPYEMGYQYGLTNAEEIRRVLRRYADMALSYAEKWLPSIPSMEPEMLKVRFTEEGWEELRGMAHGAKVSLEMLVRHHGNLLMVEENRLPVITPLTTETTFPSDVRHSPSSQMISGCVQFAGRTPEGIFLHGGNIDVPFKRLTPETLSCHLLIRRPTGKIPYACLVLSGMLGSLGGINACGLCVSSCTLLDYSRMDGGKVRPFHEMIVVRILSECSCITEALELLKEIGGVHGGWSMLLSETTTGKLTLVEYCQEMMEVRENLPWLVQSNHSQLLVRKYPHGGLPVPEHSRTRGNRLRDLLTHQGEAQGLAWEPRQIFAALRDTCSPQREKEIPGICRTIDMVLRADNVCSWMYNAQSQTLMMACTEDNRLAEDDQALWEEISLRKLFPEFLSLKKECVSEKQISYPGFSKSCSIPEIAKLDYEEYAQKREAYSAKEEETVRWVDCLVRGPQLEELPSPREGGVFVIGDAMNPVAKELEMLLVERGKKVLRFSPTFSDGRCKQSQEVEEEIRTLWEKEPFYQVFLLPSWDTLPVQSQRRREYLVNDLLPTLYHALQEIYRILLQQDALKKLVLVLGTRMGGDLGWSGRTEFTEGGALLGWMRGLYVENCSTYGIYPITKLVDFEENTSAAEVAEKLWRESGYWEAWNMVGYTEGERFYQAILPHEVPAEEACPEMLESGAVWLVPGGARGITAELALAWGRKTGAKLHLIGSSPFPEVPEAWRGLDQAGISLLRQKVFRQSLQDGKKSVEVWSQIEKMLEIDQNLRQMSQEKIDWEYHCCDLCQRDEVLRMLETILKKEKRIDGILYGAGYEKSSRFIRKKREDWHKTVMTKVGGLGTLLDALETRPPRWVIGMGSIAGRLGSNGQSDYAMANVWMAKILNRFQRKTGCRVCTFHWNPWDEVGMALRPESKIMFQRMGVSLMPVQEGVEHFLREMAQGLPWPEVIPTTLRLGKLYYPLGFFPFEKKEETEVLPENFSTSARYAQYNTSQEELPPHGKREQKAFRCRICWYPQPSLPSADCHLWKEWLSGSVLIVGENPVARRLEERLCQAGIRVNRFSLQPQTEEEIEERLREIWEQEPVAHLFWVADGDVEKEGWWKGREKGEENVASPRYSPEMVGFILIRNLARRLGETSRQKHFSITAGTFLGGVREHLCPEDWRGGWISGMMKGLRDEWHVKSQLYLPFCIVDHSLQTPTETVVEHLLGEAQPNILAVRKGWHLQKHLLEGSTEGWQGWESWNPFDEEVGYSETERFVRRTEPQPVEEVAEKPLADTEGVWVLVGGTGGVVGTMGVALAKMLKPRKIYLVGFTPWESVEARFLEMSEKELAQFRLQKTRECLRYQKSPMAFWKKFCKALYKNKQIEAFRKTGIEVEYAVCDMRSPRAVRDWTRELEEKGERVTGLFYGAGWNGVDGELRTKPLATVENVMTTKVTGLATLMETLENHPLKFVIALGSVSGRFGGNGQVDYTAANDTLSKIIRYWRGKRPDCAMSCLEWGPWDEVGMAASIDVKGALLAAKMVFLSPEEGMEHFLEEFRRGLPEVEVLFCPWKYYKRFQPDILSIPREKEAIPSCKETPISEMRILGENADARALRQKMEGKSGKGFLPVVMLGRDEDWTRPMRESQRRFRREKIHRWTLDQLRFWKKEGIRKLFLPAGETPEKDFWQDWVQEAKKIIPEIKTEVFSWKDSPEKVAEAILRSAQEDNDDEISRPNSAESHTPVLLEPGWKWEGEKLVTQCCLNPQKEVFLQDHQLHQRPFLPVVMGMEIFAETARIASRQWNLGMYRGCQRWKIFSGMTFYAHQPHTLTCTLEKRGETVHGMLAGEVYQPNGTLRNASRPFYRCELLWDSAPELPHVRIQEPWKQSWTLEYPAMGERAIYHGPSLQWLKRCHFSDATQLVGEIRVGEPSQIVANRLGSSTEKGLEWWPSLIDATLYACGVLNAIAFPGTILLPDQMEQVRWYPVSIVPGEICQVHIRRQGVKEWPGGYRQGIFNLTLYNTTGEAIFQIQEYRATILA